MTINRWLETDFFENFKCKCGACKHTCCSGWKIAVSKKEYYKLVTLDCSKQLADRIESAFIVPEYPTDEEYRKIAPNYLGYCPLLDENGLCMIHEELGPSALSEVCRSYPRSYKKINNTYEATCTNSCEKVIELLMDEDSLSFKTVENNINPNIVISLDEDVIEKQTLFTNIIKDRSIPLNTRIQKICNILKGVDEANVIDPLNAYLQVANFVNTFSINSEIYDNFKDILTKRYDLNTNGLTLFKKDENNFEQKFPKWMIYFENIIINHLYYMNVPYVDDRLKKEDTTEGLCLLYALLKIICSTCTIEDNSKEHLAMVIADIFHLVEHSPFYYNAHILINNETTLLNI